MLEVMRDESGDGLRRDNRLEPPRVICIRAGRQGKAGQDGSADDLYASAVRRRWMTSSLAQSGVVLRRAAEIIGPIAGVLNY